MSNERLAMSSRIHTSGLLSALGLFLTACSSPTSTPQIASTSTATLTPSATASATLTLVPTVVPTLTLTASVTPTATITPTPTFSPPNIKIADAADDPPSDVKDILNGLSVIQPFLGKNVGGDISVEDLQNYTVWFNGIGGVANALDNGFHIDTHHVDWSPFVVDSIGPFPDAISIFHMHTSAHEYVHLWQHSLGCLSETRYPMSRWLVEGMADYLAWQSLIDAGYPTAKVLWEWERGLAASVPLSTPLKFMEPRQNDPVAGTALADFAIDQLVKQSPNGLLALRQICESVATGQAWQVAFQSAVGLTSTEFYRQFEVSRRNPVVTMGVSGMVTDKDGSPLTGYDVWACAALDTVGSCHAVNLALDGSYKIPLPDGHYRVSLTPPNGGGVEKHNLYYSSESPTGLTPYRSHVTVITVNGNLVTGIDMQLTPLDVLGISGTLTGSGGQPLVNQLIRACTAPLDKDCKIDDRQAGFDYSAPDGSYIVRVPAGDYYLLVQCGQGYTWSFYNSTTNAPLEDETQASLVPVTDNQVTALNLQCP